MKPNENNYKVKINHFKCMINIILTIVPVIWFSLILPFYGQHLKLSTNGNLSTSGLLWTIIVTALCIIAIVVYNMISSREVVMDYSEYKLLNEKLQNKRNKNKILNLTSNSISSICNAKITTLSNCLDDIILNNAKIPTIITNPQLQICRILDELKECIGSLTNINSSYINITAAYKFKDSEWKWFKGYESRIDLTDFIKNKNSAQYQFIRTDKLHKDFIFYNQKTAAQKDGCYVFPNVLSNNTDYIIDGSLVGQYFYIPNSADKHCEFIVIVDSRYDKLFIKKEDANTNNIREFRSILRHEILNKYVQRLKIEMFSLYFAHLKNVQKKSKSKVTLS